MILSLWSPCTSHFHAGNATRFCDNGGQWGQANVLNCTSPEFTELEILVSISMAVDVAHICMHIDLHARMGQSKFNRHFILRCGGIELGHVY